MATPLSKFFDRHPDLRHHDVAKRADIPLDTFRAYVRGARKPSVENAFRIEEATDQEVPASAWRDQQSESSAA